MAKIFAGRYTAEHDGDLVVFLIGMRINRPWKVHRWLPIIRSMSRMTAELSADPQSGYLGGQNGMIGMCPSVVQYWRSFDDLDRFARDPEQSHIPCWQTFNRLVKASGDVGIWHETYAVGAWECVYGNMPRFGLAKFSGHAPVSDRGQSAGRRIGARENDEVAVPYYENPS
jgi:hypothetical protein